MAESARKRRHTFAEYLRLETASDVKHQLVDGEVFAMVGGTFAHATLCTNLVLVFGPRLRGGRCRPVSSEGRVRIETIDMATYPDFFVIRGERRGARDDADSTTNPALVAEVLSPSTERFDRGRKRDAYFQLPTLRYYLLVCQDRARAELYTRNEDGTWTWRGADEGDVLSLPDLGVELPIVELYEGVDLRAREGFLDPAYDVAE